MIIYIWLLIIPFIVHLLCDKILSGKNRTLEIIIDSIIFIAFVGLRAETVGADTFRYTVHFQQIASLNFGSMIEAAVSHESPFYVAFAWIVSRISVSAPFYFCSVAFIHYWALGRLIQKYSINVPFSYFIYSCLFLTLQLSGVKNTLATAFMFLAIDMAIEKKLWKYLLFVGIAMLFHRTSAIILIVYPLLNRKNNVKAPKSLFVGIYVCLLAVAYVFRSQISYLFKVIGGYIDYGVHEAAPISMTLLCAAIVVLGVLTIDDERDFRAELLICGTALALMPLVFVNPSALRVVRYFLCMAIFLIPKSITRLDEKLRITNINVIVSVIFTVILGWQFLGTFSAESVYRYSFFWE